jgi:hypothetical protein
MIEDEDRAADDTPAPAANDNDNGDTWVRIDAAALTIARLLGRQMAREAFERLKAANDNDPPEGGRTDHPGDDAMIKVARYARYSSDNQSVASIEDQFRICREQAARMRCAGRKGAAGRACREVRQRHRRDPHRPRQPFEWHAPAALASVRACWSAAATRRPTPSVP